MSLPHAVSKAIFVIIFFGSHLVVQFDCGAQENDSFLPTWRLLNGDQKQQFIAGYLRGWQDAAKVTDIAINYVKSNPEAAVQTLEKIKSLYQVEIKPAALVNALDSYYSDPENGSASLSRAISAATLVLR